MNTPTIEENLKHFVSTYRDIDEWFGVSAVQRHCRLSYNNARRLIDLGVKQGVFVQNEAFPFRVKKSENAPR